MNQFDELMSEARHVRQHIRECESILGMTFPPHVRLEVALDTIETGLASRCTLEVAVGYLMLRELVNEVRAEPPPPSQN